MDEVGRSNAAYALKLFAVSSYGSVLLTGSKHWSLASAVSLSRYDIRSFFCSSLVIWITYNSFTEVPLLWETAVALCCLPSKRRSGGVSTNTDMWLTKTDGFEEVFIALNIPTLSSTHATVSQPLPMSSLCLSLCEATPSICTKDTHALLK